MPKSSTTPRCTRPLLMTWMGIVLIGLAACGDKNSSPQQLPPAQRANEYRLAVKNLELMTESLNQMSDLGSGMDAPPGEFVDKLARSLNAAGQPLPGDPATGPTVKFTYVAGQVSGPWQVVLSSDGSVLRATAYGSKINDPLEQRAFDLIRK